MPRRARRSRAGDGAGLGSRLLDQRTWSCEETRQSHAIYITLRKAVRCGNHLHLNYRHQHATARHDARRAWSFWAFYRLPGLDNRTLGYAAHEARGALTGEIPHGRSFTRVHSGYSKIWASHAVT